MAMKYAEALKRLSTLRLQLSGAVGLSTTSASIIKGDTTEALFEKIDNKGVITLNRVQSHNAISHNMTVRIHKQLKVWEDDRSISLVIIKGAGTKAFSAGGDVRELAETARKNHYVESSFQFLRDEYNTQLTIGTYQKPYAALIDGYCMGGGCGLAVNGRYRVATERAIMSMPETAIGFYPDNGGSHFLSHLPGALGMYLGLTCAKVRGEDMYKMGLATHYTTSSNGLLKCLEEELLSLKDASEEQVVSVLDSYHRQCYTDDGPMSLQPHINSINRVFSMDSVEDIVEELSVDNSTWAQHSLSSMLTNSPTALKITHRMLREAESLDLFGCLSMELRVGRNILQNPKSDFFNGVKAVLIDKTGKAQWNPSSIKEVTAETVNSYFTSLTHFGLSEFTPGPG